MILFPFSLASFSPHLLYSQCDRIDVIDTDCEEREGIIEMETAPDSLSGHLQLEVVRFLRNRGSQFLFLGNRATRIGGSIIEESWFTIPILGESCHLYSQFGVVKCESMISLLTASSSISQQLKRDVLPHQNLSGSPVLTPSIMQLFRGLPEILVIHGKHLDHGSSWISWPETPTMKPLGFPRRLA